MAAEKGGLDMDELKKLLYEHKGRYPGLTAEELIKLIYQNEFGSGHFISLYFPVFRAIEELLAQKHSIVVAIDGRSGSGKTSLSQLLCAVYGCPVIPMDHFFLRPEQRSMDRLSEPGGNVDYERFQLEVTAKLRGEAFHYQIYDCQQNSFSTSPTIEPHRLTVIEGSYSHHPLLTESYDLRVYLTVDSEIQKERLLKRSGPALLERFVGEWIPLEERYAIALNILQKSDLVLDTGV